MIMIIEMVLKSNILIVVPEGLVCKNNATTVKIHAMAININHVTNVVILFILFKLLISI